MTPYELENFAEKQRKGVEKLAADKCNDGLEATIFLLLVIFETQEKILQHLADVEAELNLQRANR